MRGQLFRSLAVIGDRSREGLGAVCLEHRRAFVADPCRFDELKLEDGMAMSRAVGTDDAPAMTAMVAPVGGVEGVAANLAAVREVVSCEIVRMCMCMCEDVHV